MVAARPIIHWKNGVVALGHHSIPHEVCERKDRDAVWHRLEERKSEGAQTAGSVASASTGVDR